MDSQGDNNLDIDDIYEDFEDFDLGNIVDKYKKENEELREHAQSQESNIKKLVEALEEMQTVNESLTQNISTLFKTAKSELERKEGIIADLRSQRDNTAFRRRGGQFQTFTNNNINTQKVDNVKKEVTKTNVKNEATSSNAKKEVIDTNVEKEAILVVDDHSEGEISDKDVQDINTDIESDDRNFSDKYNKQTRENWRQDCREQTRPNWLQEGSFRDRHNNKNGPRNRYNMFQRRHNNYREPDHQNYSGKFDTNKENNTRRHKEIDTRRPTDREDIQRDDFQEINTRRPKSKEYTHREHFQELDTRRHKEIDTRKLKDREDTNRDDFQEVDTRRHKEIDARRPKDRHDFQEIDTRRYKEMDARRPKDRDDFQELDTRRHKEIDAQRPKDRDDFKEIDTTRRHKEIDTRRPKDREDTHRDGRKERDKSNNRRNEDIRFDRRKNEENKRGLIRHNPRRDSSSYLSPTRRHKSESDNNTKKSEETPKESKTNTKKMLNIVNKLEKQNRSNTPPLELLPKEEIKDEIVPKRAEPVKNFFTDHLDNILESIQSNVHEKISNSNQKNLDTNLQLESIFSDENFSQEEEISKTSKEKKKKPRRRTISEKFAELFDDSQHSIDNKDIEEEAAANEMKSTKKKQHKKHETEVETSKINSKKKHKLGVLEQEVELTSISNEFTKDLIADDEDNGRNKMKKKRKSKDNDTASEAVEKLAFQKTQESKENGHNTPASDSIGNKKDYGVEFAPPLKRYIKKCQELSEEGAKFETITDDKLKSRKQRNSVDISEQGSLITTADSNCAKEKVKSKKKRNSKELEDVFVEDIPSNSEKEADIVDEEHIEEAKTKRKRKSKDVDDDPHQVIKKSKLLKISSPRKSFSPLEDIYNEEDAGETITKKNRRFKQINDNLHPRELALSVVTDKCLKSLEGTNSKQKVRSKSVEDCTHNEIKKEIRIITLSSVPEGMDNKVHTEESTKKNRTPNQTNDISDANNIANDLNSCLAENVTKNDSKSNKKQRSKSLEDPELKSPKKGLIVDDKYDNEGNTITKTTQRSKDILDDSFEKNSTFAVVRKRKDSVHDGKCEKESPIKSFTAEEISNSILHNSTENALSNHCQNAEPMTLKMKNNTQELDELSECLAAEAMTNIGKDQTQNVSKETQAQKLEEQKIVPKKKNSPRKLDKEAFTKVDKDQTKNISNKTQAEKLEEQIAPKQKNSPIKLDKDAFTKIDKDQTKNLSNKTQAQKLEEQIAPKKKNSPRKLGKDALNKTDKDQTESISNETQAQKLEEQTMPKKSSPRKLDKEALTKIDNDQTHNASNEIQVQKVEERMVPKNKSSPRKLDKLLEEIVTKSPSKETIYENSSKTNDTSKTDNKIEAENVKLETTNEDIVQTDSFAASEESDKNTSSKKNSGIDKDLKKIVIVSDILLHSGKPKEQTTMKTENGQQSLPVHLDLPNLIALETTLKESKKNSTLEKEEMDKTKIDLPNVNRKLKTSKSVSRKDILLERYASEESQSKLSSAFSESLTTDQNEESSPVTCIGEIKTENKQQKQENLEEKINNIRKRKGPDEEPCVSVTVPNINPPKKRKVDFKLTEIEEGNNKEKQIAEIEHTLQLMHRDPKIYAENNEDNESNSTVKKEELKEQHTDVNKAKSVTLRKRRSKGTAAVRKSPRNINSKTSDLQKSSNKEIPVDEEPNVVTTSSNTEAELKTSAKNTEDEINSHKFSMPVLEEIKSGSEDLEMNSNKTEIDKTNASAMQQLDVPNIPADNKIIDNKATTEQKITVNSPILEQKNAHHLPPPLGSIPVTSTSSPIGQLSKARKRITPTPVKDAPVCSFQNILEKNKSEFKIFSKNFILESDLNLTDEGEIPILHLEENHFNNMADATQKTFDKSIMKLLDCMNVSNLDCDISKINEKVDESASNKSLSFKNVIDKAANDNVTSTPVKNQMQPPIPVSSTPKVDCNKETTNIPNTSNNNTNISETESRSNLTSASVQTPVRFRRRCRIIAVRKQ